MRWRDIPFHPPTKTLRWFALYAFLFLTALAVWRYGHDNELIALPLLALAHLLLHALRALTQRLERPTLRIHRRALAGLPARVRRTLAGLVPLPRLVPLAGLAPLPGLIAVQIAFGFLHLFLRVVEALLLLHPEALQHALQLGEPVAERALPLPKLGVSRIGAVLVGRR